MQLHEVSSIVFLVLVCLLVRAIDHRPKARVAVLLVASATFYASWDWRLLWGPIVLALLSFLAGAKIAATSDVRLRLRTLRFFVVAALGILIVVRYSNFVLGNIADLLNAIGLNVEF